MRAGRLALVVGLGIGLVAGLALAAWLVFDVAQAQDQGRGDQGRRDQGLGAPLRSATGIINRAPTCNLPPVTLPDGCPDFGRVAPPAEPIPPPCIVGWQVEDDLESYDAPTVRLVVEVDHPEYDPPLVDPVDRVYFVREPGGSGQAPAWHFYYRDEWDAACGKDEGPLAWVTGRLLQGDDSTELITGLEAVGVYAGPLPGELVDLLAELGGWRVWWTYLPFVVGR